MGLLHPLHDHRSDSRHHAAVIPRSICGKIQQFSNNFQEKTFPCQKALLLRSSGRRRISIKNPISGHIEYLRKTIIARIRFAFSRAAGSFFVSSEISPKFPMKRKRSGRHGSKPGGGFTSLVECRIRVKAAYQGEFS